MDLFSYNERMILIFRHPGLIKRYYQSLFIPTSNAIRSATARLGKNSIMRRQLKPLVYLLSLLMLMAPVVHAFAAAAMSPDQQMSTCHDSGNMSAEQPCPHCPDQALHALHCGCDGAISAALMPGQNRHTFYRRADRSVPSFQSTAVHFGNFLPPFRPPKPSSA